MLRASKAILCALAADVGLSSAARTQLKTELSSGVADVMGRIGALLQTRGGAEGEVSKLRALALEMITPGATDSLNEALAKVIVQLETEVETKIKSWHLDTGRAVDAAVDALTGATTNAVAEKGTADELDGAWNSCVRDEKAKRVAIEEAEEDLQQARNSQIEPVPDGAKADVVAKQSALGDATSAWQDARRNCLEKHESRHVALCFFGKALQRKCGKVTEYRDLIGEIEKVNGGGYSRPDRGEEWKAVAATKCMLSKVIAGSEITATTLDACESAINFDRDVGVLDKKTGEFATLTSPAIFTCDEETITFGGETWEVPTGEAPASSEYVVRPFSLAVSLDEDSSPFALCSGDASPPEEDTVLCRPGQDIISGTFQHFGHASASSPQECNEFCESKPGCTAWVRVRVPDGDPEWSAMCFLTKQIPPVWEADGNRDSGVPGCVMP